MDLNERFDVSPGKVDELKARIARLAIDLRLIEENFTRGSGKGGQKINKTSNCVRLAYAPLGLSVRCQRERKRTINRFIALRELVDQIEMKISPGTSGRLADIERMKKKKAKKKQRTAKKHARPAERQAGPA